MAPNPHSVRFELIAIGACFCAVYLPASIFLASMLMRGCWDEYWNAKLERTEIRIKRIQEREQLAQGKNPGC